MKDSIRTMLLQLMNTQSDFMVACNQHVSNYGTVQLMLEDVTLWAKLIEEEFWEAKVEWSNMVNMINADTEATEEDFADVSAKLTAELADLLYVILGMINATGLPLSEMFSAIHVQNMKKVGMDGQVHKDEFGKVLKPRGWKPVDKNAVFRNSVGYLYTGRGA